MSRLGSLRLPGRLLQTAGNCRRRGMAATGGFVRLNKTRLTGSLQGLFYFLLRNAICWVAARSEEKPPPAGGGLCSTPVGRRVRVVVNRYSTR